MSVADSSPFPIQPSRLGKLRGRVPWVCSPRDTLVMVSCQAVRLSQEHLGLTCSALLPLSLLPPVPLFRRCSPLRTRLFQPVLTLAPCRPCTPRSPPVLAPGRPSLSLFNDAEPLATCNLIMGRASLLIGRLASITSVFFVLMSSRCSQEVGGGGRHHQAAAAGNDDDDCCICSNLNGHRSTLYLGYWERSSKGKAESYPEKTGSLEPDTWRQDTFVLACRAYMNIVVTLIFVNPI